MGAVSLQQRRKLHQMLDDLIDSKDGEGAHGFLLLREVTVPEHRVHSLAMRGFVNRSSTVLRDLLRKLAREPDEKGER